MEPGFFYKRGASRATAITGAIKTASEPEMGNALYTTISSATGDAGGTRTRSSEDSAQQSNTSFMEHDRHVTRDPANSTTTYPVGSGQSGTGSVNLNDLVRKYIVAKTAALNFNDVADSVDTPIYEVLPRGAGYLPKDREWNGVTGPALLVTKDDPSLNALAHEIGHAQSDETALGRALHHPVSRTMNFVAPLAGLAAGHFLKKPSHKALGIAAALGLTVPTLAGEGIADYKGYQHLKSLGASDKELSQYTKDLALAQSSYLAIPLMTAGFGALGTQAKHLGKPKLAAAYKLQGRRKFRGLNISIENRKGSVRKWYDPHEDRHGTTVQKYPYGYIRMTKGMDGDHIDVYVGPHEMVKNVYVILTSKPPTFKQIDEQKCMLGFNSATAARKAFAQHYDKPGFFRSMKAIPYEDFERKVLATLHGSKKKIASNRYQSDDDRLIDNSPGTFNDQVPGDYLGLPSSSLVGMRTIKGGHPEDPQDAIDRMFRFHDNPMSSRVLEGDTAALPESPGV